MIALAGAQQGRLGRPQVAEVAQEPAFLPGRPQEDQRIVELLVELADLVVEQSGPDPGRSRST